MKFVLYVTYQTEHRTGSISVDVSLAVWLFPILAHRELRAFLAGEQKVEPDRVNLLNVLRSYRK